MEPLRLNYRGQTKTLDEWSSIVGINKKAIWLRIKTHRWTVEDALEIPIKAMNRTAVWQRRVDRAIETVQEIMFCRGYFKKGSMQWRYKMLNTWYKEFRSENMKAA